MCKKKKKTVGFLMAVFLMFSLIPVMSYATDQPIISVANVTAKKGSEVSVPISLSGNTGICGMTLTVNYDESLILTKVERGAALSDLVMTEPGDLSVDPVNIVWDGLGSDESNGTIATLSFKVPDEKGKYEISVSYTEGDIVNEKLQDVLPEIQNGSITLTNTLIGDVNEDGKVNRADAGILNRYFAGWQGYEEKIMNRDAADVNRDSKLTRADAGIMNRYFAGWQGYDQYFHQ